MSGEVQLKTIADYQAAIQKLDRNNPKDLEKIKQYNAKIGEILSGATKDGKSVNTGSNDVFIHSSADGSAVSVKAKNQVPNKDDIAEMKHLREKENVADEFAVDENGERVSDEQLKQLKDEYKAAKRAFKEAEKAAGKIKFDMTNPNEFNRLQNEANTRKKEAQARLLEAETKYEKAKAAHDAEGGRANRGIRKAAKHNEKNYTNVENRQEVYLSKDEEKAAIAKNPALKGHTKVLSEDNMKTLMAMDSYARAQIEEAEKSGSKEALTAAKERFEDWTKIFGTDENGEINYASINTRNAQKALTAITGDDANGNLDEVKVAAKQLGVSKGDVKGTLRAFGFGTESALGQKFRNAGITAAVTALGSVFGKTHSHQKAEASATAQGETVQGEVSWLASNGEEFYKYYEAKGGDAAVSVVAEACAKIPAIGKVAAPVLAGVTAFFLTKGKTEDAFNGANVEAAMKDLSLIKGKDNKAIVNKIQDLTITGNKGIDDAIKASVIKASIGEDTKSANTEELLAAYKNLQDAKNVIGKIPEQKVDPPKPPKPTPQPEKPDLKVEHEDKTEKIRTTMPRLPYREGTWYTSHGYVDENGNKLSEAERRKVQAALRKDENMIGIVDTNNDGKLNGRDKEVSLPNEIEIDGKKYKLAPDARERIMKLPAKGGGSNGKYAPTVEYDRTTRKWFVKDNKTGNRIAGPYNTEKAAEAKKQEFLDNPDTIPKDK